MDFGSSSDGVQGSGYGQQLDPAQVGVGNQSVGQQQYYNQSTNQQPNQNSLAVFSNAFVVKLEQIIMFIYFALAALLLFRFGLSLFGANQGSPFVNFVYQLTAPFMFPFINMFGRTPGVGQYRLEFEVLIALLVYALVLFGLARLVRIVFR